MNGTLPDLPGVTKLVRKLQDQTPPTSQTSSKQAVQAGNATIDFCTVVAINDSFTTIGSGTTALVPGTAHINYQNTDIYGVGWIGNPPTLGPAYLLIQPPVQLIMGAVSTVVPFQLAGGALPNGVWWQLGISPAPSLAAGWSQGFGGNAQFRMIGDEVAIRGAVVGTTASPIFTLPVGYRPAATFDCLIANDSAITAAVVTVQSNGIVTMVSSPGGTVQFELTGIRFSTS